MVQAVASMRCDLQISDQNRIIEYSVDRYTCFLRILMTFEVVLVHFGCEINYSDVSLIQKPFLVLEKSAVPVFIMLAFFYSAKKIYAGEKEWLIQRLKRLFVPFWIWSAIYCLVNELIGHNLSGRDVLAQFIFGSSERVLPPFWYIWDLMVLTLFIFVTFYFLKGKRGLACLEILVLVSVVMQYSEDYFMLFNNSPYEIKYTIGRLHEMLPYAFGGIVLYNIINNRIVSKYKYVFSVFAVLVLILSRFLRDTEQNFGYAGLKLMFISVPLVFLALLYNNSKNKRIDYTCFCLSKLSFGVYCMHWGVGHIYNKYVVQQSGFAMCITITIICYLVAFCIACTRIKLLKMLIE